LISTYASWLQLFVCLVNCIVGLRLFKNKDAFRTEIKFIYTFCCLDLITTILFRFISSGDYSDFTYDLCNTLFIVGEILLLPAYIRTIIGEKNIWHVPIIISIIIPSISYYFLKSPTAILQVFSGIYISYYCIKYLLLIFTSNNTISFPKTKHYWIIIGLMTCYTASIPACIGALYFDLNQQANPDYHMSNLMLTLFTLLNIAMHFLFNKAFLWKEKQH
jgi:hypothetical protein